MFAILAIAAVVVVVVKPELVGEVKDRVRRAYDEMTAKPCCAGCKDGSAPCAGSGSGLPPAAPGETDKPPGALTDLDPDQAHWEDDAVAVSNIRDVENDPFGTSLSGVNAKGGGGYQ